MSQIYLKDGSQFLNNKVYVILVNYNGWKDTIECLESVLKSSYENYQIIVIDNNSTDNSMRYIINWAEGNQEFRYNSQLKHLIQPLEHKPIDYVYCTEENISISYVEKNKKDVNPLVFIQASKNIGFSGGNNIGIKYAFKKNDFDYIWLLNNDTVIEKDTLKYIIEHSIANNLGITGSSLMYFDYPEKVQAYYGKINRFFGTSTHILTKPKVNDIDYIVGASFLINKKVIEKIGFLPEEYFLYYEDTDYSFKAKNNGFKLGVSIESKVYHKEGNATGGSSNVRAKSEFSDILSLKNRIRFHKKYLGGGFGLWIGICISILNRLKRGQLDRVKYIVSMIINIRDKE